jgi:cobalt-zinc-cadmium efflux system protein
MSGEAQHRLILTGSSASYDSAMGHDHGETLTSDRRALGGALALILAFMAAEIIFAVVASSLALFADAGHMLTDAAALGLAIVAASMAARPASGRWTFGFKRVEVLAAQINGLTLLVIGIWIVYGAVKRLIDPPEVRGGIVVAVALVGIAVNIAATWLLSRASRESINVRGAFVHVMNDLAAFIGTALAGVLILATGWNRFDPIASLVVAGLIAWSSARLLRDSTRIFLERAPADIDPAEVGWTLIGEPEVVEAHDLHIWTVTSGFPALSAHVLVQPGADCHETRRQLEVLLHERFGLEHTTLQVDHATPASAPVELGESFRRETPLRHG